LEVGDTTSSTFSDSKDSSGAGATSSTESFGVATGSGAASTLGAGAETPLIKSPNLLIGLSIVFNYLLKKEVRGPPQYHLFLFIFCRFKILRADSVPDALGPIGFVGRGVGVGVDTGGVDTGGLPPGVAKTGSPYFVFGSN